MNTLEAFFLNQRNVKSITISTIYNYDIFILTLPFKFVQIASTGF